MYPPCPSRVWTVAVQWLAENVCFQVASAVPVCMSWSDSVPGPEAEVEGAAPQRIASFNCIVERIVVDGTVARERVVCALS